MPKKTTNKSIKFSKKTQKGGSAAIANSPGKSYKFTKPATNTLELLSKAINYCQSNNFQGIIDLLNEIYTSEKHNNFKLDVSLTDPFIQQVILDADFYNRWYRVKLNIPDGSTEELKKMSDPSLVNTLQIPEYKTLLAQISRDCLIMLITYKRNIDNQYRLGNNKISKIKKELIASKVKLEDNILTENKKILEFMKQEQEQSNETIKSTYTYKINRIKRNLQINRQDLENIDDELSRLEQYNKSNKSNTKKVENLSKPVNEVLRGELNALLKEINECIQVGYVYSKILFIIIKFLMLLSLKYYDVKIKEIYNEWINTPFIFFPTYQSIDFQTVVALVSAPIINFRISNRTRSVHSKYNSPWYDAIHDVNFHAAKTHKFNSFNISYKNYFTTMNEILKLLFPYYYCTDCMKETDKQIYAQNSLTYFDLTEQNKKNVISLLLFTVLHEMPLNIIKNSIYNFDELKILYIVDELKKEVSNNMFDRKYPFVNKLEWTTVVNYFVEIIRNLNYDNTYNELVKTLPDN